MNHEQNSTENAALDCAGSELSGIVGRLAEAHWEYVESVLRAHGEAEDVIAKCAHHYKTAFAHGWKHAEQALT